MPEAAKSDPSRYRDVCFVIMPFGKKEVGAGKKKRKVNFDKIYEKVFEPAINAVELPASEGGGTLRAKRTDKDFFSGDISQAMFEYIEYSRFALADITGLNANVFYELGARHRAHESGTVIFRQEDAPIPFDINQIKAFPYIIEPKKHRKKSKKLIRQVLTESLEQNAWDSPIRLALRGQQEAPQADALEDILMQAENALRNEKPQEAAALWERAAELDPDNPLHDLKASAHPKSQGEWDKVIALMHSALAKEAKLGNREESSYGEAYRELGIAQNKKDGKTIPRAGEESLRKAVQYAPNDFDAWASLGGVMKRAGDEAEALRCYEKSVEVSNGHAYPLLNALKLRARRDGKWTLDDKTNRMLIKAEGFRESQVEHEPPIDVPWSFYDLAEMQLFAGDKKRALKTGKRGMKLSTADWMPGTFLKGLESLPEDPSLDGLEDLKALAKERLAELGQPEAS